MPNKYETKVVEKFLFFPVKAYDYCSGKKVIKFLQKARIEYIYSPQNSNSIFDKWEPRYFMPHFVKIS
jgi:hypothetical protein